MFDLETGEIYEPPFSGQDYYAQLRQLENEKRKHIADYASLGSRLAKATVNYKKAMTVTAYRLKASGLAVSFITKFIDGEPDVANALEEKLSAEAEYSACDKKISSVMQDINTVRMQVEREQPSMR